MTRPEFDSVHVYIYVTLTIEGLWAFEAFACRRLTKSYAEGLTAILCDLVELTGLDYADLQFHVVDSLRRAS